MIALCVAYIPFHFFAPKTITRLREIERYQGFSLSSYSYIYLLLIIPLSFYTAWLSYKIKLYYLSSSFITYFSLNPINSCDKYVLIYPNTSKLIIQNFEYCSFEILWFLIVIHITSTTATSSAGDVCSTTATTRS